MVSSADIRDGLKAVFKGNLMGVAFATPIFISGDAIRPPPEDTPGDTGRVSLAEFRKANPEFAEVDFSAIGKLHSSDGGFCTAVLLEPGNIVATARHCINTGDLETAYSLVAWDSEGIGYEFPLAAHGERYFQYAHFPTLHYFDPDIDPAEKRSFDLGDFPRALPTDIAFFQLTPSISETIKLAKITPAAIAPAQTVGLQKVFAAGYSSLVRDLQGEDDSGLSITKEPCDQAFDPDSKGKLYKSTCHLDRGDSGGAHFVLDNGRIAVTAIQHTIECAGVSGQNKFAMKALLARQGEGKMAVGSDTCVTPLTQMWDFCLKTMGPEHCGGFPAPGVSKERKNRNTTGVEETPEPR